jgi:hypothetical protein
MARPPLFVTTLAEAQRQMQLLVEPLQQLSQMVGVAYQAMAVATHGLLQQLDTMRAIFRAQSELLGPTIDAFQATVRSADWVYFSESIRVINAIASQDVFDVLLQAARTHGDEPHSSTVVQIEGALSAISSATAELAISPVVPPGGDTALDRVLAIVHLANLWIWILAVALILAEEGHGTEAILALLLAIEQKVWDHTRDQFRSERDDTR